VEPTAAVHLRDQAKTLQRGPVSGKERIDPAVALRLDEITGDPDRLPFVGRLQERTGSRDLGPNAASASAGCPTASHGQLSWMRASI
jgi:hypothetical protein